MANDKKILVVDDEASVRRLVASYLAREGYQILEASNGDEAIKIARREKPALVVLDLMLPGIDGLDVCRILSQESDSFVLMLTARSEETDKLVGLGLGADDYLTKPFSPRELVARVKAILRRGRAARAPSKVTAGAVVIDRNRHTAAVDGRNIDLTAREFEILNTLASRPGMVFTREQLLEQVWGYSYFGDPRVVDVHMAKLRKKIEDDSANPRHIKTIRGVGYKLET
ncbi:MAG: response regulator transcription factor [Thermoleophilia bacterium]|nr:response regulator transcription factor [Thermoleophilia bacterium]